MEEHEEPKIVQEHEEAEVLKEHGQPEDARNIEAARNEDAWDTTAMTGPFPRGLVIFYFATKFQEPHCYGRLE